jgi:hypothetical protein
MVQDRLSVPKLPAARPVGGTVMLSLLLALGLIVGFSLRVSPGFESFVFQIFGYGGCSRVSNETNATTSLKSIAAGQFDFRSGDYNWNQVLDFWKQDVAGLYTFYPAADPSHTPIRRIELSVASADDRPFSDLSPYAVRSAKAGYWFRALLHEDETTPSPDRFAVCAFPDSPSAGKWTYIIDEENFVYRKQLKNQRGIERYPQDPLKAGWQKVY